MPVCGNVRIEQWDNANVGELENASTWTCENGENLTNARMENGRIVCNNKFIFFYNF